MLIERKYVKVTLTITSIRYFVYDEHTKVWNKKNLVKILVEF